MAANSATQPKFPEGDTVFFKGFMFRMGQHQEELWDTLKNHAKLLRLLGTLSGYRTQEWHTLTLNTYHKHLILRWASFFNEVLGISHILPYPDGNPFILLYLCHKGKTFSRSELIPSFLQFQLSQRTSKTYGLGEVKDCHVTVSGILNLEPETGFSPSSQAFSPLFSCTTL